MQAEIIAIGSELLTPQRLDTNSLWLTDQLNALGVEVVQKTIVGDERARLTDAIRAALSRSTIVILTGGLGPTEDDVTRDAVAEALNRQLEFSEEVREWLQARFARSGRIMAEINLRQAYLIQGAEKLENNNGTAPGQWVDAEDGRIVILLPGPPREMKPLFTEQCVSRLQARLPHRVLRTRFFRVAGMGESDLDALISPAYKPYNNPVTTVLAAIGDIQVHLRAFCETEAEAETLLDEVGTKILNLLGDRVYSTNGDPLEAAVGQMLVDRSATIAVAESCTGGLLGARLSDVPGSSRYFVGGFQVYNNQMKAKLLGLDPGFVEEHGAVSEAVAIAMAQAAQARTGATYALSVTGEAGPTPADPDIKPGTVWIGLATPHGAVSKVINILGDRDRVRSFAVQTALNLLRLKM